MKYNIFIISIAILFIGCTNQDNNKTKNQSQQTEMDNAILQYKVLKSEDLSYNSINRLRMKIQVDKILTENEMKLIGGQLIQQFKKDKYNAAVVFFYQTGTDINGEYNAGMIEWGPDGSWENAGRLKYNNYSKHDMKISICKEVVLEDKTGIPLEKRKKIFYDIALEEDRLYEQNVKGDKVQIAAESIARKYNITIQQVKDIGSEGVLKNWPMPN